MQTITIEENFLTGFSPLVTMVAQCEVKAGNIYDFCGNAFEEVKDELHAAARMERGHAAGFKRHLNRMGGKEEEEVAAKYSKALFDLLDKYIETGDHGAVLLIQGVFIEAFAIAAYESFCQVCPDQAFTTYLKGVIADENIHLQGAESFLEGQMEKRQQDFSNICSESMRIMRNIVADIEDDLRIVKMDKDELTFSFLLLVDKALIKIGFERSEIVKIFAKSVA